MLAKYDLPWSKINMLFAIFFLKKNPKQSVLCDKIPVRDNMNTVRKVLNPFP